MKVLSYILGGLLIIAGIFCMFNPAETVVATGYVMAILLLVYGIIGILNVIMKRTLPIFLLASIPATIIGIIALVRPGTTLVFDAFMVYLFAAWFVVEGITSIIMAVKTRLFNRGWVLTLIIGILSVIVGIYSFVHPNVSLFAIGILIGIYLVMAGIDLIVITATVSSVEDIVDEAKQAMARRVPGGQFREAAANAAGEADDAASQADSTADYVDNTADYVDTTGDYADNAPGTPASPEANDNTENNNN